MTLFNISPRKPVSYDPCLSALDVLSVLAKNALIKVDRAENNIIYFNYKNRPYQVRKKSVTWEVYQNEVSTGNDLFKEHIYNIDTILRL